MNMEPETLDRDERINLSPLLTYTARYWWVVVICIAVGMGLSLLFLKIKSPAFTVHATVALNQQDDEGGTLGGGLQNILSSMSLGGPGYRTPEDEIMRMTSQSTLKEAAKRSGIYFTAWSKSGLLSRKQWYYGDSPVKIDIPVDVVDTLRIATLFHLKYNGASKNWTLSIKQRKKTISNGDIPGLPYLAKTPAGIFRIDTTSLFNPSEDLNFYATIQGTDEAAQDLKENLDIGRESKKSNIIWMQIDDANTNRAKAVLNNLIEIYNENALDVTHQQARQTVDFIDSRLATLYSQLDKSESDIQNFKESHNVMNPDVEAEYIYKSKSAAEESKVDLLAKANVVRLAVEFLSDPANRYAVVPFTPDMPSDPLKAYNELVLQRMKLASTVKGTSQPLNLLSEQIDAMRQSVLASLKAYLDATNSSLSSVKKISGYADSRISNAPAIEKQLTGLLRDRYIKNMLYGYLLQKREEAEMRLNRNVDAGQVIDSAYDDIKPSSPNKPLVLAGGFLFGLLMGFGCLKAMMAIGIPKSKVADPS